MVLMPTPIIITTNPTTGKLEPSPTPKQAAKNGLHIHLPDLNPLDAFKGLNLGNWILRIGEILLGVVLIGVGVAKLTGTTNAVAGAAKTAGKAAVFL
jgi:hypothetical protein